MKAIEILVKLTLRVSFVSKGKHAMEKLVTSSSEPPGHFKPNLAQWFIWCMRKLLVSPKNFNPLKEEL